MHFDFFSQLLTILPVKEKISYYCICMNTVSNLFFSTTVKKCHKSFNKITNFRHLYVEWELWKVVKNSRNGKMIGFTDFIKWSKSPLLMINPLDLLKLNTKTQFFFCYLNENLMTFLYTLIGATRKQKEKKVFFYKVYIKFECY